MTEINKLQIFYQNAKITKLGASVRNKKDDRTFVDIEFYQTNKMKPRILYKPVSKTHILKNEK